jgi:hypothetical protein
MQIWVGDADRQWLEPHYGSLAPGGTNQNQLEGLDGQRHDGAVKGNVEERDGFLEFHWRHKAKSVPVKVLSTSKLDAQFVRLDRFEGPRYHRILVPIVVDEKTAVCNIYEGKRN